MEFLPDDTVIWSAIGGADIYRGQAAPATAGLHGHDEFFADFAKQVLIFNKMFFIRFSVNVAVT
jgi:hypothetical protein